MAVQMSEVYIYFLLERPPPCLVLISPLASQCGWRRVHMRSGGAWCRATTTPVQPQVKPPDKPVYQLFFPKKISVAGRRHITRIFWCLTEGRRSSR